MRFVLIDDNDFTFSKIFGYFCVVNLAFLMKILVEFKYQFKITKSIAVKKENTVTLISVFTLKEL